MLGENFSDYNKSRGQQMFLEKIKKASASIDPEHRAVYDWLSEVFFDYASVQPMPSKHNMCHLEQELQEFKTAQVSFEEHFKNIKFAYSRLCDAVKEASSSGISDLESLKSQVIQNYIDSYKNEPKSSAALHDDQSPVYQSLVSADHEEIDNHSIKKQTWKEIVIQRDENGEIMMDENGSPITEEVEMSNTTLYYSKDHNGNVIEHELLMEDLDLLDDFDDEDLTIEGMRSAGLIRADYDSLSDIEDDVLRVAETRSDNKLPLGQVQANEDGTWDIICPYTNSTEIYQINFNTYASFKTGQPFRVEISLGDLLT